MPRLKTFNYEGKVSKWSGIYQARRSSCARYQGYNVAQVDKPQFRGLLKEHLVPILSGSEIRNAPKSERSHALVAFETPVSLFLKPDQSTTYRLRLRRRQRFDKSEKALIETFIGQLAAIGSASPFGGNSVHSFYSGMPVGDRETKQDGSGSAICHLYLRI